MWWRWQHIRVQGQGHGAQSSEGRPYVRIMGVTLPLSCGLLLRGCYAPTLQEREWRHLYIETISRWAHQFLLFLKLFKYLANWYTKNIYNITVWSHNFIERLKPLCFNVQDRNGHHHITDIAWYRDQLYLVSNTSHVHWYNLTSHTRGRLRGMESVGSIAVDWIGKKLYWSNPKQQLVSCSLHF